MFENILLPIDGSHSCLRAMELTASIAKKFESKITVLHVISHDFMHPELKANFDLPPLVLSKLDETYQKTGEKILKSAVDFFHEENINVETVLEKAYDPAERILEKAKSNFDLIVLGNISEEQEYRYSLGSTAEKVSLYSSCPVLITKRKTEIGKLLVAYDNSEQANKALKFAINLCQHFKSSKITVLNVEKEDLHRLEPDIAEKVGKQILDQAATTLKEVTFDKRLEFGNPANVILKIAKTNDYDLIVLGGRGLSKIKRFLLGSVSADVSMHAERSVLIVR